MSARAMCEAAYGGVSEEEIKKRWPLHWLVWNDEHRSLDRLLGEKEHDHELVDPRGRSPLHLAVSLKRVRCTDVLLSHGANTLALNRHNWTVLNEAVCGGNPELIGMVLRYRDQQQAKARSHEIPVMLERLQSAPDFYIEMKWEFSSWLPFISRMCPSDTYRIWKKGTSVRVDTTLIGFEQFNWLRGNLSFVFRGTRSGAHVSEINHDKGTVLEEEFRILEPDPVQTLMAQEMGVLQRLSSPVISTVVDTESVAFQRQKSGVWGFRSDKIETINGYPAKVFSAAGLDIVTRTRVEHLPETEKTKHKSVSPLQDFLGTSQDHPVNNLPALPSPMAESQHPPRDEGGRGDPTQLSMEEYFSPPSNPKDYDALGRPAEVFSKVQTLKANVWLAEDFPVSLQQQMMPIIELMALNNAHFAKLKDFITLQMPAGFPVKFEIPLFHVMSAKVTFGNLNGHTQPAPHVSLHTERLRAEPQPCPTPSAAVGEGGRETVRGGGVVHRHLSEGEGTSVDTEEGSSVDAYQPLEQLSATVETEICTISEECYAVPAGYRRLHRGRGMVDDEEELLQLAIQQSLMDQPGGGEGAISNPNEEMSLTEALKDRAVLEANDPQMQSAIRASLGFPPSQPPPSPVHSGGRGGGGGLDPELELALAMSRQQSEQEEEERRRREEEELEMVLRLSLEDK